MQLAVFRRTWLYYVVAVLTLAAASGIIGRISLYLAIPPGYATAFWPVSGLALVAVLMGGARVAPGIWLGSFMAYIGTAFDATDAASLLTSVAIAAALAVGAVVQALVGAALVHRGVSFPNTLTRARDIGALLALGGPVSCLISPSIGVTVLAISGQIPWSMYAIHWGTWWVGNTFGVLITIPLVLSWLAEPRASWSRRRLSVALPIVGALALAVALFGYTYAQERERLRLLFEREAEALAQTMQTRLDYYMQVLQSLESFSTSVPEMSGQAFDTFVQRLLTPHPGLRVLAWNLRVPDTEQEADKDAPPHELSSNLQSPDANTSALPASGEISLAHIEPHVWYKPALGLDVASILGNRDALQQARDTGLPAVTGRLTLEQEPTRQYGLLVFLPIHGQEPPSTELDAGPQNLRGYVTGIFRIGDMVEASMQSLKPDGIILRIEDEVAALDQRILYDSRWEGTENSDLSPEGESWEGLDGMHWKATVELAGRHLSLHFAPTPEYLAARESYWPWAALAGGLAFTGLLGAFLLVANGRAIVIELLMVERTTQLETSKQLEAVAKQRRRTAESLAEVGRLLSQSLDSLEVGQQIVDHVHKLLQARVAALYQFDPASGGMVALAARDDLGAAAMPWPTIPLGMGVVGLAVQSGQPVVTPNVLTDSRIALPADIRTSLEPSPVRTVLALPLLRDGLVIGALSIGDVAGRVFDEEVIQLARFFADQASSALANAQLYAEVQAARERLQSLSRQLLDAQEAERRRVAHELHDEAGQLLVFVHLALEAAVAGLPPQFREGFQPVRDHLDAIETELRRLSHELRPTILDDLGLLPALQCLTEGVAARTRLAIRLDNKIEGRLDPHIETALYRIIQEGLTNITRHAAATRVQLQLRRDARMVHVLLQDDGVGFDVDRSMNPEGSRGLGLLGIEERLGALGGTLQITSASGQGTTLQVSVPIGPWETASEADRLGAHINSPVSTHLGGPGAGTAA